VATVDVPGAFMQAKMDELLHMRLEGPLAMLLTKVNPEKYEKYKKGKPVIYVKLLKASYGMLQVALLFWQDLTKNLESWGFKVNAYDPCVMNMDVNGKQCTVLWHVDDLKISHVDPYMVSNIIEKLNLDDMARKSPWQSHAKKYRNISA
jgi:hypothetical protein